MRILSSFILFLGVALRMVGATYYVTQSGAGSADGSTLGNAASVATLNSHTSSAGDVISLNGTITTAVTVHDSGSAGNVITYLFATGAKFTSAAWALSGAINANGKSYFTIDGGTNGIIENTANGSSLANHVDSAGINLVQCSNATVQNCNINNIFVRTSGTDQNGGVTFGIYFDAGSGNCTNLTATNNIIHDACYGINTNFQGTCSNYTISYNTVYNCNWGGGCGDRNTSSSLTGLSVHHNIFYNWTNWDDTSVSNSFHHNGFYAYAGLSGSTLSSTEMYANKIGPGFGSVYQTSGLFVSYNVDGATIYNNLFVCAAGEYAASGMIYLLPTGTSTFGVYNNTFAFGGIGACISLNGPSTGTMTVTAKNNLGSGGGGGQIYVVYFSGSVSLAADYDLFYNFDGSEPFLYSTTNSYVGKSIAQWQALGFDTHGTSSNPLFVGGSDYSIQTGSPAKDTATSISSIFTNDFIGTTRPQGPAWDMGAYEFIVVVGTGGSSISGAFKISGNAVIK